MKKQIIVTVLALTFVVAAPLWAGPQARISGKIIDSEGNPVTTATVTYTTDELTNFEKAIELKEDGTFKTLILDATRVYVIHITAPGFRGHDEEFKVDVGTMDNYFEYQLKSDAEIAAQQSKELKERPGFKELEEGKELMRAGKNDQAKALFEQALIAVPTLLPALEHLAEVQYEMEDFEGALETAKKCLKEDEESLSCLAIAANTSDSLGDNEAHQHYMALFQTLNPDDPASLFNQAVVFLNAMDDEKAKPILEQCLEADPTFPKCLFEYGMVLLRSGDIDGAKAQFEKYLEVAPDGEDATTAAETVKYL